MREGIGACLQSRADDHDDGASEDGLATAQIVANPDAEDGTEETAQVV